MQMDEMPFFILSQAGADEPFCALVSGINWRAPVVLEEFLRALAGLVDEGLLAWRLKAKDKKDWSPRMDQPGFYGELLAYVEQRVRYTEVLTDDRDDGADYLFSITPQGAEKMEELHADADARGRAVMEAIRDFNRRTGRLPSQLAELWPEYAEVGEPPFGGCGGWWYKPAADGTAFRFGYFTICGHHQFYDALSDEFRPLVPPATS
jgi:hypothetical protein